MLSSTNLSKKSESKKAPIGLRPGAQSRGEGKECILKYFTNMQSENIQHSLKIQFDYQRRLMKRVVEDKFGKGT